jgi:hypothetical protein
VNALKRAIYTGRVGPAQARRADEMQAVADALSLRIPRDPGRRSALMPDSIPP